jgi:hypothetical protein
MKMFSYAKTEDDLGLPLHIRIEGRGNPLWLPLVYYYLETLNLANCTATNSHT